MLSHIERADSRSFRSMSAMSNLLGRSNTGAPANFLATIAFSSKASSGWMYWRASFLFFVPPALATTNGVESVNWSFPRVSDRSSFDRKPVWIAVAYNRDRACPDIP
ncbi:MAG: hypothetical protein NTW52_08145 [Planctomycetota bacterium]|nr:hypothetical protein [Planctomycetota bacterium]